MKNTGILADYVRELIYKQGQTEQLDDPLYYLDRLWELGAFKFYESDGQFTGGYSTDRYIYDGMIYEFDFDPDDTIIRGCMYPEGL